LNSIQTLFGSTKCIIEGDSHSALTSAVNIINELLNLSQLTEICMRAAEWKTATSQPCGLIAIGRF